MKIIEKEYSYYIAGTFFASLLIPSLFLCIFRRLHLHSKYKPHQRNSNSSYDIRNDPTNPIDNGRRHHGRSWCRRCRPRSHPCQDCVEEIDAQRVLGYALYKDGRSTRLSYPLEKISFRSVWEKLPQW